jgi:hypothetical protein
MPLMIGATFLRTTCWLGFCIALAGCSSFDELENDPKPPPAISKAAANIKTVAGQYHLTGSLEIAGPIEAPVSSLIPWVICLRSAAAPQATYALFYKADTYLTSRMSTIADRCDGQTYQFLPN